MRSSWWTILPKSVSVSPAKEDPKEEKEKQIGRVSIKKKQAEKKVVIEQRDKAEREVPEKGTEKKSEREI